MNRFVCNVSVGLLFLIFGFSVFAQPQITDATWSDETSDGNIDRVVLTFDVSVDIIDGGAATDGFDAIVVNDGVTDHVLDNQDVDDQTGTATSLTLDFTGDPITGTDITGLNISYDDSGGGDPAIFGSGPIEMSNGATEAGDTDSAAPVITAAETVDSNEDGFIEGLLLTFSENIDDSNSDFTSAGVDVVGYTGETGATGTADDDQVTINFTPQSPPNYDTDATLNVNLLAGGVQDAAGNAITANQNFTTTTDAAGPVIVAANTNDNNGNGQVDQLILTFSEDYAGGTLDVTGATSADFDDFNDDTTYDITGVASTGTDEVTLTISESGSPDTDVTPDVTLINGQLEDPGGNAIGSDQTLTATDVANPVLVSSSPANDATGVAINTNVVLIFSEDVQDNTGNIQINDITNGTDDRTIAIGDAQVSITNDVVTIDPSTDFNNSNEYAVQVAVAAIQDLAAIPNDYAGIGNDNDLDFTTIAPTPTIVAAHFFDTDSDGDIDEMVIELSEEVDETTAETDDFSTSTGLTINGVSTVASTNVGNTLDANDADEYVTYEVTPDAASTGVPGLSIVYQQDNDANDLASASGGIDAPDNPNVMEVDQASPVLLSSTPADEATGVSINTNIDLTFSEDVQDNTGNIQINDITGSGTDDRTIAIGDAEVSIANDVVTINPSTDFNNSNEYAVQVAAAAIQDLAAIPNDYAGISNNNDLNFTTIAPTPTIDGAHFFDTDSDGDIDEMVIELSEEVDETTAETADFTAGGGLTINSVQTDATVGAVANTLDATNADEYVTFEVTATGTSVAGFTLAFDNSDANSNDFNSEASGIAAANSTSITLIDQAAPIIISAETRDLVTIDGIIDGIEITFSEDIQDPAGNEASFEVGGGSQTTTNISQSGSNQARLAFTGGGNTTTTPTVDMIATGAVTDLAGVDNELLGPVATTDGAPPFVAIDDDDGVDAGFPYNNYPRIFSSLSPQITGVTDDPGALVFLNVDGNGSLASLTGDVLTSANPDLYEWQVNPTLDDAGTYEVEVTSFDSEGNTGNDQSNNEIEIQGGVSITSPSANLCNDTEVVILGNIVITENDDADFASGSGDMLLQLPSDFFFNTSALPSVTNTNGSGEVSGLVNFIGNAVIQLNFNVSGTSVLDEMVISGLEIAASGGSPQTGVTLTRISGSASVFGAGDGTDFATLSSLASPPTMNSFDVGDPVVRNDLSEFKTRINTPFTLNVNDQFVANSVSWFDNNTSLVHTAIDGLVTETELEADGADPAYFDTSQPGVYSFSVQQTATNGCNSLPLAFNVLLYDDDDLDNPGNPSFVNRTYNVTDAVDKIYLSNPANHTVSITGNGISIPDASSDPIVAEFDPSVAGDGGGSLDHIITYSIRNDLTGESMQLTRTFTVQAAEPLYSGTPKEEYCVDDTPETLTVESSDFSATWGVEPYLLGLEVFSNEEGGGNILVYNMDGQDLHLGITNYPISGVYQYDLNPADFPVPDGEYRVIYSRSIIVDPSGFTRVGAEDDFVLFGRPKLAISNLSDGDAFCSDEPQFNIKRNLTYTSSVDRSDPFDPVGTITSETDQDIENGYLLYKFDGTSNDAPAYAPGWNFVADFTNSIPGVQDEDLFFPSDPDQSGSFTAGEAGDYLIAYTTEDLTAANCTATAFVEITVSEQPAPPTLDNATQSFGGSLSFVNGDEYLLEYCVGTDISSGNIYGQEAWVATEAGTADDICYYEFDSGSGTYNLLGCDNNGMPFFVVLPVSNNVLVGSATEEFFMTQRVDGCESDFRKVTVQVYDRPEAPTVTDPDATLFGTTHYFDFCFDNGAMSGAQSFQIETLGTDEAYQIARDEYDNGTFIGTTNFTFTGSNIPVPSMSDGDRYLYFIRKVENINGDASSSFAGCAGEVTRVDVRGFEEPAAVSATDFVDNTLEYHVAEGDDLGSIDHVFGQADEYTWYETNVPNNQIGSVIASGDAMLETTLDGVGFDPSVVTTQYSNDVYTYYVTRTDNINSDLGFDGCESADNPTALNITVHAIQRQPDIASDNTAVGALADFTDLNNDGDGSNDDGSVDHYYSICTNQLDAASTFVATESNYTGNRFFEWYAYDFGTSTRGALRFTGDQPDFANLQLASISSSVTRYFEVVQITDIDQFAGVESESTLIRVDISEQDVITFEDTNGDPLEDEYCADESTDVTINLQADGMDADDGNGANGQEVSYTINSYVESNWDEDSNMPLAAPDNTLAGSGNPTIDFDAWHTSTDATAALVGGPVTFHEIIMTYADPVTSCVVSETAVISVYPDPDITFTINGNDSDNVEFCYDDPQVALKGLFADLSGLPLGTGTFSGSPGLNVTTNNETQFDPSAAHGGDPFAAQSMHVISFTYTDEAGCDNSITKTILVNPRPELLGASGDQIRFNQICQGADSEAFVQLTTDGVSEIPDYTGYSFQWVVNGTDYGTIPDNNQSPTITEPTNNLNFNVIVTDPNGCTVQVDESHQKQPLPILEITGIDTDLSYCEDDTAPDVGLEDDGTPVDVSDINSWSITSSNSDGSPVTNPTLEDSDGGSLPDLDFDLGGGKTVFQQLHEDAGGMATGGPSTTHTLSITYTDPIRTYQGDPTLCTATVTKTFTIHPPADISFEVAGTDVNDAAYVGSAGDMSADETCYGDAPVSLEGIFGTDTAGDIFEDGNGTFSGPGVVATGDSEATFNPTTAHPGPFAPRDAYTITYEYTSNEGCSSSLSRDIYVNPLPEAEDGGIDIGQIQFDALCFGFEKTARVVIYEPGTTTEVSDYSNYMFDWEVSIPTNAQSQSANTFTFDFDPDNEVLNFNIEVTVTNLLTGCTETYEEAETQGFPPTPAFTYLGLTEGEDLTVNVFEDNPSLADGDVDYVELTIQQSGVNAVPPIVPGSNFLDPIVVSGLSAGTYDVQLTMGTPKGCETSSAVRKITILPKITVDPNVGYLDNFDTGIGDWYIEVSDESGKSDTGRISTWMHNNGRIETDYVGNEVSYLYSPAFDLRAFESPAIRFNREFVFDSQRDGLVVQYSTDDGANWFTLGSLPVGGQASGLNWYNIQGVSSGPGEGARAPGVGSNINQLAFTNSEELAEAKNDLIALDHKNANVRFRFALSAIGGDKAADAFGFAFDDFGIFELEKLTIVEQFSSTLNEKSKALSLFVSGNSPSSTHNIDWELGNQGVWINYYTDLYNTSDEVDMINARNKVDPGTRGTFYGISDVPVMRISGSPVIGFNLETSPEGFENTFSRQSLDDPDFIIDSVRFDTQSPSDELWMSSTFQATASAAGTDRELVFYYAIVEKEITGIDNGAYNPSDVLYSALRKLLPKTEGMYYRGDVEIGQTFDLSAQWTIDVYDPDQIRVIAFAQDYQTREILQADFMDVEVVFDGTTAPKRENVLVGVEPTTQSVMLLYPNPADAEVTLQFSASTEQDLRYRLADQSGKEVLAGRINRGEEQSTIDVNQVPSGLYILQIFDEEGSSQWQPKKVMIKH